MTNKPKYFRKIEGHIFGWEFYGLGMFFFTFSWKGFEIQINKWPFE